jgi:hypothetical protein
MLTNPPNMADIAAMLEYNRAIAASNTVILSWHINKR